MQHFKMQLRQFITDNFLYGRSATLTDDESFIEGGLVDSTGILELISYLEQQHGIAIEDEELRPENLDSIDKVAEFVIRKQAGKEMRRAS